MAGGHSKRVSSQNKTKLQVLNGAFFGSLALYVLHLFVFKSGRTWFRLFLFVISEGIAAFLWLQLVDAANKGADLAAPGLIQYMQDICYVTWLVHAGAAAISTKFWYLYLVIPGYAAYRFVTVLLPQAREQMAQQQNQQGQGRGVGARNAQAPEPTSKRQQKLQRRLEKGDKRVQQRQAAQ